MQIYHSGFKLAELDLQFRGMGDLYGFKQHGFTDLKIASLTDFGLINKTKTAAAAVLPALAKFSSLQEKLKNYTIKAVEPN